MTLETFVELKVSFEQIRYNEVLYLIGAYRVKGLGLRHDISWVLMQPFG